LEYLQTELNKIAGAWTPGLLLALFLLGSFLMLWRTVAMTNQGGSSQVISRLARPYISSLGNLLFIWIVIKRAIPETELVLNLWTNNLTSLCLLLALPALIWGLDLNAKSRAQKVLRENKRQRLSLALTLSAMICYYLITWQINRDGEINRNDGFILIGLFALWQCLQIFEELKKSAGPNTGWQPMILLDLFVISTGGFLTLLAVEGIVDAITAQEDGFISGKQLGLVTAWLMVLPNAGLACYYGWQQNSQDVYQSQVGDAQVCIPLGIGLFAIFKPLPLPEFIQNGLLFLAAVALVHLICSLALRELPRLVAATLLAIYGYALFIQLSQ
jgi:cation:H+ antiporter